MRASSKEDDAGGGAQEKGISRKIKNWCAGGVTVECPPLSLQRIVNNGNGVLGLVENPVDIGRNEAKSNEKQTQGVKKFSPWLKTPLCSTVAATSTLSVSSQPPAPIRSC